MAQASELAPAPTAKSASRMGGSQRQLESVLDRARDERLRLARLVKDYEGRLEQVSAPASAEMVARLTDRIEALGRAVDGRFTRLDELELELDAREQRVQELEASAREATQALADRVRQAQGFSDHVDAAKQHVRLSAGAVVEDIQAALSGFEAPIAEQLERLQRIESSVQDRVQSVERLIEDRVTGLLGKAGTEAEAALAPVQDRLRKFAAVQAKALADAAKQHRDALDQAALQKVSELDIDVEESIRPVAERFAQEVTDASAAVDGVVQTLRDQIRREAEQQAASVADRMNRAVESAIQQAVIERVGPYQDQAEAAAQAAVDGAIERLQAAHCEPVAKAEAEAKRLIETAGRAREQAAQAVRQLKGQAETIRAAIDEAVNAASGQISGKADDLHGALAKALEAAQAQVDTAAEALAKGLAGRAEAIEAEVGQALQTRVQPAVEQVAQASKRCQTLAEQVESSTATVREQLAESQRLAEWRVSEFHKSQAAANEALQDKWREQLRALDHAVEQGRTAWQNERDAAAEQARKQIARIGEQARRFADDAVDQTQKRLEASLAEFPAMAEQAALSTQAKVDDWSAEALRKMRGAADRARGEMSSAVVEQMGKADEVLSRFREQLDAALAHAAEEAGQKRAQGESAVQDAQAGLEALLEKVHTGLREATMSSMSRADELVKRYQAQLEGRIHEAREAVAGDVDRDGQALRAKLDAIRQETESQAQGLADGLRKAAEHAAEAGRAYLNDAVSELERQADEAAKAGETRFAQVLDKGRESIGGAVGYASKLVQQLEQRAREAATDAEAQVKGIADGLQARVADSAAAAEAQAAKVAESVRNQCQQMMGELKESWSGSAEHLRQDAAKLVERVRAEAASSASDVEGKLGKSLDRVAEADRKITGWIDQTTQRLQALDERAGQTSAKIAGSAEQAQSAAIAAVEHLRSELSQAEAEARKTVESLVSDLGGHVAFEAESIRARSAEQLEAMVADALEQLEAATTPVLEKLDHAANAMRRRVAEAGEQAEAEATGRGQQVSDNLRSLVDVAEREAERRVRSFRARAARAIDDARQAAEQAKQAAIAQDGANGSSDIQPTMDPDSIRQASEAMGARVTGREAGKEADRKSAA
ncbi:MAG: hypothetical protein AAF288_11435 [Planctomycetota bacterium]